MERKRQRKSVRIPDFDFSQTGYYYVTICTRDRICFFGYIQKERMYYSQIGKFARRCWKEIPKHYPDTKSDIYQIIPNHMHGIIFIKPIWVQNFEHDVEDFQLPQNRFQKIIPRSLCYIIRGFKIGVTKLCKQNNLEFRWQRNYYEHVIENENDLDNIREYIKVNPFNWEEDIKKLK